MSFLLSLFFELTQVTGLYFIYPRGYRLFDVDDLMANTLGGLVGYFVSALFLKFLPTRTELDQASFRRGKEVSLLRRLLAFMLDIPFAVLFAVLLARIVPILRTAGDFPCLCAIFYFGSCHTEGRLGRKENDETQSGIL